MRAHTLPFLGLGNVSWDCCRALKWQNGAKPPPALPFTGSWYMSCLKSETKTCQARLLRVRNLRASRIWEHDRDSLQIMCIGPGVTFGKLKFVGYNCQESIPQKGTSFDVHLDVVQEVGSTQLTSSSWMGKEVLPKKPIYLFFEEMGERKPAQFLKGYKRIQPHLCSSREGEIVFGWLCSRWCCFGKKTCFLSNTSCQVRESKYSERTAACQWDMAPAYQYSAILFLHCVSSCREN